MILTFSRNYFLFQTLKRHYSRIFNFYFTAKILKSGKIFSCFYFANSSPYRDMWLSCLSRAITPSLPAFRNLLGIILANLKNFYHNFEIVHDLKYFYSGNWPRNRHFCVSKFWPDKKWFWQYLARRVLSYSVGNI